MQYIRRGQAKVVFSDKAMPAIQKVTWEDCGLRNADVDLLMMAEHLSTLEGTHRAP